MLAETIQLIQSETWRMECLETVDSLGLHRVPPEIADVHHAPGANLLTVGRWILDHLDAGAGGPG
jgi:hypothetical protein